MAIATAIIRGCYACYRYYVWYSLYGSGKLGGDIWFNLLPYFLDYFMFTSGGVHGLPGRGPGMGPSSPVE